MLIAWLGFVYGIFPENEIDHVNGVHGDNRISNLREATRAQNGRNRKLSTSNTSGYTGVCKRRSGRWSARIGFNQRYISLGCFDTSDEAHLAYECKSKELYGEFKRLSTP
jgi:hypothetical protein